MPDTEHVQSTRRQLGELAALASETETAERKILENAEKRLTEVSARVDELRPQVNTDQAAADEYTDLVSERGALERVIKHAREVLDS